MSGWLPAVRLIPSKAFPGRSPKSHQPSQTAMHDGAAANTSGLVLEVRRRRAECPDPQVKRRHDDRSRAPQPNRLFAESTACAPPARSSAIKKARPLSRTGFFVVAMRLEKYLELVTNIDTDSCRIDFYRTNFGAINFQVRFNIDVA